MISGRKLAYVYAERLHGSMVLPEREFDPELVKSIKRDGIQQAIIVRPSSVRIGKYEIIDGHIRYESVESNQQVLVDIREDADDEQVFKISEATFKRKPRTTYERTLLYGAWVKSNGVKYGPEGAQAKTAEAAGLSEAEISYYVAIGRLFDRLPVPRVSNAVFNALKCQSMNKLCEIAKVEEDPVMLAVASKLAALPKMTLKQLKEAINKEIQAADPIWRLAEEDEKTKEKQEKSKMSQLQEAAQRLEDMIDTTKKALSVLRSNVDSNPRVFLTSGAFERIERMMNSLKRIEKEAGRMVNSSPQ